jgi:hypothetical protein
LNFCKLSAHFFPTTPATQFSVALGIPNAKRKIMRIYGYLNLLYLII